MRVIKIYHFVLLLLISSSLLKAQDIDMFRTIYFPSEPYGGADELKSFVRQEIVYPETLLQNDIKGSVFITYLVNSEGDVTYKEVVDFGDSLFRKEAERVFDKILWQSDKNRAERELGYEKIKFNFNPKKYNKLVKQRGYHNFPNPGIPMDSSNTYYNINQLSTQPKIKNSESVGKFINEHFKYPEIALQMGISGRVTIEFIIEPYGLVSNVHVIEPIGGGCNDETIRLVKEMRWHPGIKDNKAVRTLYEYHLNFVHPGGTIR